MFTDVSHAVTRWGRILLLILFLTASVSLAANTLAAAQSPQNTGTSSKPVTDLRLPETNATPTTPATGTPAARTRIEQARERVEDRAERRETRATARDERRGALSTLAQRRVTNLAANISNRMEAAITRLEHIADRFDSRLTKLEATGIAVTGARESVARARSELDAATATLSEIDHQVAGVVGSENPRAAWPMLRATYASARDSIRAAHLALREALVRARAASNQTVATPPSDSSATTAETATPATVQ